MNIYEKYGILLAVNKYRKNEGVSREKRGF